VLRIHVAGDPGALADPLQDTLLRLAQLVSYMGTIPALSALAALVGEGGVTRAAIATADESGLTVVVSEGHRHDDARGAVVPFADLPATAREALLGHRPVSLHDSGPIDIPTDPEQARWQVLLVPLFTRGRLSGAFLVTSSRTLPFEPLLAVETLAGQVSLALESAALTEEIHRRRAERRFRVLVEHSFDVVLVVDDQLTLTYVTPSSARVLGYEAEELVGRSVLELIHHDDAATASRVLAQADPEGPPALLELQFRKASGAWVLLEAMVSDLRQDPAVAGIVLNARDVTERRRSEERWRAFGSEASHQLRTPLTGLRLSIENALGDSSPQWHAALEDALGQVDRLQTTVEDFLALAPRRVDSAPPLDVTAVVEDMDAAWRGLVEAEGRQLVVDIEPPLPIVHSSAATVRQVLGVLIDNALKHGDGCIRLVAKQVAGGLALEVSDEGEGLSVKRNGAPGNKHMGLALARTLAEAEGGRLLLRRIGPSPTFTLFMPAANGR
jgi:PAS domain S-box-containing protein